MYAIDGADEVVEIKDVPAMDPGAPGVLVTADDRRILLQYSVRGLEVGHLGPDGRIVLPEDIPESYDPVAYVEFEYALAHALGPPNDEALRGHPLAPRGLRPYGAYEVGRSSWIRSLEKMNRVHPRHSSAAFADLRHFIFTFHDSTFECIAKGLRSKVVNRRGADSVAALITFLAERD